MKKLKGTRTARASTGASFQRHPGQQPAQRASTSMTTVTTPAGHNRTPRASPANPNRVQPEPAPARTHQQSKRTPYNQYQPPRASPADAGLTPIAPFALTPPSPITRRRGATPWHTFPWTLPRTVPRQSLPSCRRGFTSRSSKHGVRRYSLNASPLLSWPKRRRRVVPNDVQWPKVPLPQLPQEGLRCSGVAVPLQFHPLHLAGSRYTAG